jgi:hypothetical protein
LHFFSTTLLKTTTNFNEGVLTPTSPQTLIFGTLTISIHEILDLQVSSEYYGVKGCDIDHCYSLHPKCCPNKSTNNKDGKIKRGYGKGMIFVCMF